ncbi:MAG: mechanosensitive ion channel family protein [Verrucomicrobiota bacterium]
MEKGEINSTPESPEVEAIKNQPEIKEALEETAHQKTPEVKADDETKRTVIAGGYFLVLGIFIAAHFLLKLKVFSVEFAYRSMVERAVLGGVFIAAVLFAMKLVEIYLLSRVHSAVSRFNLTRILHLITGLAILFIGISMLFSNWTSAVVSLGLISLILGFALQTPISSFIGWIYILTRHPYRVGDRIRIGDAKGDVIDVSYLDTTLWEIGGEHLSTDHPSGRIIKFPNSKVLNSPVWNYSWPLFPYIWNEIKFQIAYESDLNFVSDTMQKLAEDELGQNMKKQVSVFRELLSQTPVDHLEVREHPSVFFRVSENAWLEATVRYLVDPKMAGRVKNNLIRQLLAALNAAPDKVLFPKSNAR